MTTELARIGTVVLRRAERDDLPAVLALLAADRLGAHRESPDDLAPYHAALAAIDADPAQLLVVAVADHLVIGVFQLTVIPGLARRGALRAHIEAVRIAREYRGRGLGAAMMRWALDEARRRGCTLAQLTSDKARPDAHRFYERLGFVASHEGFKLAL